MRIIDVETARSSILQRTRWDEVSVSPAISDG